MRGLIASAALLSLIAGSAAAQTRPAQPQRPPAAQPPAPPPPEPEAPPPPYEPQLLKLAEIMGSLSYLRTLCATAEARDWQDRMNALLEAEGRGAQRRERLTGAYNRGYRAYAITHRRCTAASEEAAARLAQDGERLSRDLTGRFGG